MLRTDGSTGQDYTGYWTALNARCLGLTVLETQGGSVEAFGDPKVMNPYRDVDLNPYRDIERV